MYGTYSSGYGSTAAPLTAQSQPSAFRYTVREGDSLASVVAALNTTEQRLLQLNPLLVPPRGKKNPKLYAGQQLAVEEAHSVSLPPPPQCIDQGWGQMHVVRAGESLQSIARQYHTTESFLRQDNRTYFPSGERGTLFPGQMLHVRHVNLGQLEPEEEGPCSSSSSSTSPSSSSSSSSPSSSSTAISKYKTHRVTKRDTLESLSSAYGLTIERLLQINRGRFPVGARPALVVGEPLIVPDVEASRRQQQHRHVAEIKLTKQIHVVEYGETPQSIADRFRMTYEELREFNRAYFPKGYRGEIQPGYKLVVKRVEEEEEEDDYRPL